MTNPPEHYQADYGGDYCCENAKTDQPPEEGGWIVAEEKEFADSIPVVGQERLRLREEKEQV
jgi:hypothetical protein